MGSDGQSAVADTPVRHRVLPGKWRVIAICSALMVVALAINQLFGLRFFVGRSLLDNQYQYAILGLLLPLVFLVFPAHKRAASSAIPAYDILLAALAFGVIAILFFNGEKIVDSGWEMGAPDRFVLIGTVFLLLVLEATRRVGGPTLFFVVAIASVYPVFADKMPLIISGLSVSPLDTIAYHAFSAESVLGIPLQAFANLVIGFLVFGVALTQTGGGKFFIDLAFSLLGHVRGGPAKVAIFSSGLMGSMSGSVVSNVITTGVLTIPTMKKTGFRPAYAGGVEACASTGGVLMPPIMGSTAFIMATFIGTPYVEIAIAAIVPSFLYYLALFLQIDAYSARQGLKGLARDSLPSAWETLRSGWYYLLVLLLLIVLLVYLKQETIAPFYATAVLIALNQLFSRNRWSLADFWEFVSKVGILLAEMAAMLAGVGLIIGALSITGLVGTLVNDLVYAAGGSISILLLMGALTSFIMGIGMTVTAAYIFLAIVLAPALAASGLDLMSVHLFILYWGMVSFITPPVALGAFAAASVAGANAIKTGFEAMRLGIAIYIVPFLFVLDPSLILRGELTEFLPAITKAIIGLVLISGGLQGYLIGLGTMGSGAIGLISRSAAFLAGLSIALPASNPAIPLTNGTLILIAVGFFSIAAIGSFLSRAKVNEVGT